jgi:release factor glutamine methyltransferase
MAMTIAEALRKYTDIESDLLLGHVLKQTKEFLYMNLPKVLTASQQSKFERLATKRLQGWPVAYLIGYKYFYGFKFKVNRNVLIPRPESEWLVEEGVKLVRNSFARKSRKPFTILEIGTGSGCIAISLAKLLEKQWVEITATDISEKALQMAITNSLELNAKVKFVLSDLLNQITGKFDLIIANLPYVPLDDYVKFHENLKFEPKLALIDGSNQAQLVREFLSQTPAHLKPRSVILIETDPSCSAQKIELPRLKFCKSVSQDFRGLKRFIKLTLTSTAK